MAANSETQSLGSMSMQQSDVDQIDPGISHRDEDMADAESDELGLGGMNNLCLGHSESPQGSPSPATPTPAHYVNGVRISLDFTRHGSKCPSSSCDDEAISSIDNRAWSPPASNLSSSPETTPEPQAHENRRAGSSRQRGNAFRDRRTIQSIETRHGTIVDAATGLPTPCDDNFGVRAPTPAPKPRDDFRTDWELPLDVYGDEQSVKAAAPWLPNPLDDSPDPPDFRVDGQNEAVRWKLARQGRRGKKGKGRARGRRLGAKKRQSRRPSGPLTSTPASSSAPEPEPERQRARLFKLPAELRLRIYRELLVAKSPIIVYDGWRKVYRHQATRQQQAAGQTGLGLCTAILSVHPLFHAEGLPVLYRENTFLYRLRDAKPTLTDVSRLPYHDERDGETEGGDDDALAELFEVDDDGDDDASDWEQDRRAAPGRRRPRPRRAKETGGDIDVDKYRHLFRRIVVEAEQNRFSDSTMRAMALAIDVFRRGGTPAARIHTLTVRVAPLRVVQAAAAAAGSGDDEAEPPPPPPQHPAYPEFTFVNFFARGSPVLQAIQDVECQFLHVNLRPPAIMDSSAEPDGADIRIDRRPEIVARRFYHDSRSGRGLKWLPGSAIAQERKERARLVYSRLQSLGDAVSRFCRANVMGVVGGMDMVSNMDGGF